MTALNELYNGTFRPEQIGVVMQTIAESERARHLAMTREAAIYGGKAQVRIWSIVGATYGSGKELLRLQLAGALDEIPAERITSPLDSVRSEELLNRVVAQWFTPAGGKMVEQLEVWGELFWDEYECVDVESHTWVRRDLVAQREAA